MKQKLPTVRQFGQASLESSLISKSRIPNEAADAKTPKKPISLSDFLNRKIGRTDGKLIKEKHDSFSSFGFDKKEPGGKKVEESGGFIPDRSVFQRFNQPILGDGVAELQADGNKDGNSNEDRSDSKKRKNPFWPSSDDLSGDDVKPKATKYLVVLGDDPKPKPKPKPKLQRTERKLQDDRAKPFYNHYENGCGLWDGDREGVDNEEVGCSDVWEGMGSTTLGGLEWH